MFSISKKILRFKKYSCYKKLFALSICFQDFTKKFRFQILFSNSKKNKEKRTQKKGKNREGKRKQKKTKLGRPNRGAPGFCAAMSGSSSSRPLGLVAVVCSPTSPPRRISLAPPSRMEMNPLVAVACALAGR